MSESGLFGTRKRCGCNGSAGSNPAISISSVIATKGRDATTDGKFLMYV